MRLRELYCNAYPASSLTSHVCNWLIGRWECCQTGHGTLAANVTWMICVTVALKNVHVCTLCVCVCVCVPVQRVDDYIASGTDELKCIQHWWNYTDSRQLVQVSLCAQIWDRTRVSRKKPSANLQSHVMALASSSDRWSSSRERSQADAERVGMQIRNPRVTQKFVVFWVLLCI